MVWNDKACFLRAISVLTEYQSHCTGLDGDVADICICARSTVIFVHQVIHLLSLRKQLLLGRLTAVSSAGPACAFTLRAPQPLVLYCYPSLTF